jgi:uncharacterized membrane protein YfcA
MNDFAHYFKLGVYHILDLNALDHILFVVALCAVYLLRDWKKLLILILAITVGHSISLTLATLHILRINRDVIEFLIPVSIAITAFSNLLKPKPTNGKGMQANYLYALLFGLVHGVSFSSYLGPLLRSQAPFLEPLLAFNIGLAVGQLVIVIVFLLCASLLVGMFGTNRKEWTLVVSAIVLGMSLMMMIDTKFW